MGQRLDTIERISNINHGSLAERLYEIRELRKLVRKTETKRRKEKSISRIADQRSSVRVWKFFWLRSRARGGYEQRDRAEPSASKGIVA
jgi:hypothetical protein